MAGESGAFAGTTTASTSSSGAAAGSSTGIASASANAIPLLGMVLSGLAKIQEAEINKRIGGINADLIIRDAKTAEIQFAQRDQDLRRSRGFMIGAQRAGLAKAGVVAGRGSALRLTAQTAGLVERALVRNELQKNLTVQTLEYRAAVTRWQADVQAKLQKRAGTIEAGIGIAAIIAAIAAA